MKVKYLGHQPGLERDPSIPNEGTKWDSYIPLTEGRVYVVYAVAFRRTVVRFCVFADDALPYPLFYDAELFVVVDNRIPSHWHFAHTPTHKDHQAIMSIEEWVSDPFFYDRLTDGSSRERMLLESPRFDAPDL